MTASIQGHERSPGYRRIETLLAAERCVILDGAMGTELPLLTDAEHALDERLWGTHALEEHADAVLDVHRRYVEAGCDVVSTNTWGLPSALDLDAPPLGEPTRPFHWMDVARRGLEVARTAAADGGCAVAFSLNGDVDGPGGEETVRLLSRLFAGDAPDLVLVETLSLVRESLFEVVEALLATGLPVWLSFRRCRHGLCGVYGQHWGGPEGDAFGRSARRFEEMGIGALLVNCVPPDHVDGMISYLRDFTDLPLGAYPNLGYYTSEGWRFDQGVGGAEYAEMALRWRGEGAQIVGGCCGVGPGHIAAAGERLEGTRPGRERPAPRAARNGHRPAAAGTRAGWQDAHRRSLFPLPFPDLGHEPGVVEPSGGSFLAWRHVFREHIGAHQRCLDVGCGTGLLTVQLALNGARHVHAIDIDRRAVLSTQTNAFRNGVAEQVSAATVDLYPWVPDERYEVIVSSLDQAPADPLQHVSTHRPADYWGRSLFDQLLAKLPDALAAEGVAYVVHLSVISRQRTDELLADLGLVARVADWRLDRHDPDPDAGGDQVRRVEELSDAYRLHLGGQDLAVAYLLEIRHAAAAARDGGPPWERGV